MNDDNGLAVRRIDTGTYDQKRCLGVFGKKKAKETTAEISGDVAAGIASLLLHDGTGH